MDLVSLFPDDSEHPDLFLSRKEMHGVMTNDRVQALAEKEKNGERFYGVEVKVLERGVSRIVGKVKNRPMEILLFMMVFKSGGAPLVIPFKNSKGSAFFG